MNKVSRLLFVYIFLTLVSCESRFPVDKKFWTPEDYKNVFYELNYKTPKGEEYPRFSNPETELVVRKIVDPQNYETILEDTELGLNYRNEVSQEFFEHIGNISEVYNAMDIQDKFVYAEERAEIRKFFLGFQIVYFRIGNENIASQSDDQGTIRSNERALIGNFNNYLEDLRREKAYGAYAKNLADGISIHFTKLIDTFPKADYTGMLATAKNVEGKLQTPEVKEALAGLIRKLEEKQTKKADPV